MKKSVLLLLVFAASLCPLTAQVTVEVTLDQDQFLPGEALNAAVRITNHSGRKLRLGGDERWLRFAVESSDGFVVLKRGEVPVMGEFDLESSQRATKRVDLVPYFDVVKPGRYTIRATIQIPGWTREITSPPQAFDIINGAVMWEQEFGVPPRNGEETGPPVVRKYVLQQAKYLRKQLMLYFRLTDSSGNLNKVVPVGPMVSFSRPDAQVDRSNNLHVLYQDGARSFNYSVFDTDGRLIIRQTHMYTTRPALRANASGGIEVVKGERRVMSTDVPPPPDAEDAPIASVMTNSIPPAVQ